MAGAGVLHPSCSVVDLRLESEFAVHEKIVMSQLLNIAGMKQAFFELPYVQQSLISPSISSFSFIPVANL
ncbi:hypothetical protein [Pseudomonas cichorii]|uniref:hypothetical protein n=1 Tax=Pseudomonas cichorii TaxID=36746 RepID=UPI001C89080E|nr:hypothetical protein [Pseudomonas cichorii]MBX8484921.1 hypothetical protein [Pseudomonas cichorii]MBX8494060.1 hypothetical protein [Pseudomonas cichorii]MBX8515919.1 hypothetical protein [Pseudomonas cichorii]MBX8574872.1 hypothetical protein [Pseudomonas cichorii]